MEKNVEESIERIAHYKRYPLMKPFIGINYFNAAKKILIIGESHFFDHEDEITEDYINSSPTKWYSSSQKDLHESKHKWIFTRDIIKTSKHMVFRELDTILESTFEKIDGRAINNIAYMNGFQRPANKAGASIKGMTGEKDFKEGAETIQAVIDVIEPEYVIFISKFTWDTIGSRITKKDGIHFEFINHPASIKYWNDKENSHSKYRLIEILKAI